MVPPNWLNTETVQTHRAALAEGSSATAVALSVLDVNQPANWEGNPPVNEHWCLAHYLLDGHHKLFAAAEAGLPVRLLAFVAHDHGLAEDRDIAKLVETLRTDPA